MDFKGIAAKWQRIWDEKKAFEVIEAKDPYYVLEMFPYPSAYGIHMGHARNYSIGDCYARFMRMRGKDVLYPMGYDSFGLPAENAAIKNKIHPRDFTEKAIENITKQLKAVGFSYDWTKTLATSRPEYYRWTQWLFLQFYKKQLAVKKKAPINWCPSCQTVLANEQVEQGRCWRCKSEVQIKDLEQWFFTITAYAQELLDDLDTLEGWPDRIKLMQRNWIGRSTGTKVRFKVKDSEQEIEVFTTRPDTLYGVTYVTLAPEHPLVMELVEGTDKEAAVKEFVRKVVLEDKFSRTAEDKPKEGVFIGRYALHPLTGTEVPIYIANFVLLDYGTGCVMAVPAHDQRDHDFAKKYALPIVQVIAPQAGDADVQEKAYTDDGVLIHSGSFDGLSVQEGKDAITAELDKQGKGGATIQFKIRDWLLSRQRYWGCPIPIVYCDACGAVPIPEEQLPVLLPDDVQFSGEGNPLATSKTFIETTCPSCGKPARRETDTMDTFVDSSWYYLRYTDPAYAQGPFDRHKVDAFLPVDMYIGGAEHAVMHLLYARFFTKVMRDLDLLTFDEPFTTLRNQGMVTLGGTKMSKSLGNVVDPLIVMDKYGPDTLRFFLLFVAAPDSDLEWSDEGIDGAHRFLRKIAWMVENDRNAIDTASDPLVRSTLHRTLREVKGAYEGLLPNKAIVSIMELANTLSKHSAHVSDAVWNESLESLALVLAPITPHLCEEIWQLRGNEGLIAHAPWPEADESLIDPKAEFVEEYLEEIRASVQRILRVKQLDKPSEIVLYPADAWKYGFVTRFKELFATTKNPKEIGETLAEELDADAGEVMKLAFATVKNMKLLPSVDVVEADEKGYLEAVKPSLEDEFGAQVRIGASSEENAKAKNGLPGRPAVDLS